MMNRFHWAPEQLVEVEDDALADLVQVTTVEKAGPPGPAPRPGLEWKEETHRWVRPWGGDQEVRGSKITIPRLVSMSPEQASDLLVGLEADQLSKLISRLESGSLPRKWGYRDSGNVARAAENELIRQRRLVSLPADSLSVEAHQGQDDWSTASPALREAAAGVLTAVENLGFLSPGKLRWLSSTEAGVHTDAEAQWDFDQNEGMVFVDSGMFEGKEGFEQTVAHEFSHVLIQRFLGEGPDDVEAGSFRFADLARKADWGAITGKSLVGAHEYGEDAREALAEALSHLILDPSRLKALEPALYREVEKITEVMREGRSLGKARLVKVSAPPRPGLVPESGDPEHPYRWIRPEGSESNVLTHVRGYKIPQSWDSARTKIVDNHTGLLAMGFIPGIVGRKYLYSAEHTEASQAAIFSRGKDFDKALPGIRTAIERDLRTSDTVDVLYLIDQTGFRIGGVRDTQAKVKAYGASTLKVEHVTIEDDKAVFSFPSKKGGYTRKTVTEPKLVSMIKSHLAGKEPGDSLFNTTEAKIREYLKSITGKAFKVKDFRTWRGTMHAQRLVNSMPRPLTAAAAKKAKRSVAESVAEDLQNTWTVSLGSYIAPEVWAPWDEVAGLEKAESSFNVYDDVSYDRAVDWTDHIIEADPDDDSEEEGLLHAEKAWIRNALKGFGMPVRYRKRLLSSLANINSRLHGREYQ